MPFTLDGKIALVTGGTRGIGKAIAAELARAGATVVIASRKEAAVSAVVDALRAEGLEAFGIAANVSRMAEARALVDRTVSERGGVDIVVNNAAVSPVFGPMTEIGEEAFDKIVDVNVKAPLEIARRALPSMTARGGGSIINISSIDGVTPQEGLGIYSMSKAALISLTKAMAQEWGSHGVRANAICPGLIKTDFSSLLWNDEALKKEMLDRQSIPRVGEPEDVAGLALFLASDASSYCTGGVFMVDGGFTI